MIPETYGEGRLALKFENQTINIHEHGNEFEPKAKKPMPGSQDLSFMTKMKLEEAMKHVKSKGVEIIEGPAERTGATGSIVSFFFRDPDGNLVKVANCRKSA
jgi:catechol 2,3-dioxygenase-like lactoylglutathione lyase family enzyme